MSSSSATAGDAAITEAKMGASGGKVDIAPAVAVTLSNVTTTARVGTDGTLTLTGSFTGSATQVASASSTAGAVVSGGSTAAIGVGLALTIANHTVTATTARSITAGGAITLKASGVSASAASASASASGAPENSTNGSGGGGGGGAGGGVDQQVQTQRTNADATSSANGGKTSGSTTAPSASTSDGKVNVAAAIALDLATTVSQATIEHPGLTLTAGGLVTLASSANTDAATSADGSASQGATATIGAAVAITLANVTNQALLPAGDTVHAKALTVSATETVNGADVTSTYGAQATSGAGGGKISVAGSLGLAVINQTTTAEVAGTVVLTGGDATIVAASNAASTVKAEPTPGGVTATNVGVGASVALNLITDTTTATLDDGVSLTGAANVTMSATAADAAITEAKMGATGGKVDIAPAVAVTLSNVTTTSRVGTLGAPLSLTGSFTGSATQNASASSTAGAVVAGGTTAAIGVGVALTIANHTVTATTARSITAGGDIALRASGISASAAAASASASGAPENGASGSGSGGGGGAGDGVDKQVKTQRDNADATSTANGGKTSGSTASPSASTSDGKVNVAAAVGIDIATVVSKATIENPGLALTAGGLVTLASSANTDAASAADGSASHGATATIGAGVAITLANVTNQAILPTGDTIKAHALTVSATVTPNGADTTSTYGAQSVAGAGQGKISVAGSVAIAIINQATQAELAGNVTLTGGNVAVTAASKATSTVSAEPTPGGVTATNVGVGASVALNLITDTTNAVLDAGITVVGAHDFILSATAGDLATTDAKMGASGGKVDVSPAVAITISNVTTTASIGTLPGNGTIVLTGSFSATATQTAGAVTSAGSVATGGSTASIGVALALNLVTHTVSSTTGRNITAAGSISFGAFGSSVDGASASASASGAPQQGDSNAPSGGVDGQAQKERTNAIGTDTANGGSGSSASANPSASSSDGKVSVAAGVALNIADVSATSILPDGLTLIAGGAVSLRSSENVDGAVKADGTAVKATNVGVGVAVALNLVTITNRSYIGERTHVTSNGFDLEATMTSLGADTTHTFTVEADAGAGSKKIGVAGALALNIVTDNTEAYVPGSAVVAAGTGDISLIAQNLRSDSAKALADASIGGGGTVGVGASIAINVLTTNVTRAEVMDGASLTGGHNVTLTATSAEPVVNTVTAGSAGSSVAVSPAVGINIVVNTTLARIGTPGAGTIAATGAVQLRATHTGSASITGDAKAASSSVAVGAIIAVNVLTVTTTAALLRNISGTSVVLAATTTTAGSADVTASAQGTTPGSGGSSDGQAKDSVQNTPSTSGNESRLPTGDQSAGGAVGNANSESGGQSGQSSGQGVGVGAAVSVNVVTDTNTASIADGLTVTAAGAIQVSATNATDALAKSVGTSTAINSTNIGAGIGLNVAIITNRGSIGVGTTITGGSVVVQAVTPPQTENDFTAWGLSAAGGAGDASVAGSVAVQVVIFENTAVIGAGSKVSASGALVLAASNPMGLQTIAGAGGLSLDGSGVGVGIAVNVLTVTTLAYIDSNIQQPTTVNAGGAISLSASASLVPLGISIIPNVKVPDVTSVAVGGGAGTSGVAVGGAFIVDVFNLTTQAYIGNNASVNQSAAPSPGQSISITASDDIRLVELAGSLGLSLGSVGVGVSVIVGVINKDVRAYIGHSVVASAGGDVTLRATDPQDFTEIAIGAAASQSVGVTGSFVVLVLNPSDSSPGTRAYIDGGPRQATVVHAGGNVTIQAEDNASNIGLYAGQVSVGGSAGVGISAAVLVRSGIVDAWIAGGDDIWAKGATGLTIGATQNEDVTLIAVGGTVGGSAAVAGSATVDVLNNVTHAHIDRGATINSNNAGASGTEGVSLSATDTTTIKGVAGQIAVGGSAGIGAGADVEVLNKDTQAWIDPQVSVLANGSVTIDAASSENVISISAGVSAGGSVGVALNAAVSVFTIVTKAFVGEVCSAQAVNATSCATSRATILAGGSARISANEQLTLNVIAGSIAIGGEVGVGASAAVPIVNKTTSSFIGDNSVVRALGNGAGLTVNTGGYSVTPVDTRFTPSTAIEGDGRTIDLGYVHGFTEGQQVLYDAGGGTPITGLVQGNVYYVHVVSAHEVQLSATQGGPAIVLGVPSRGGESQRLMATDHAATPQAPGQYFTPSSDVTGNVINLPYDLTVNTGDPVVYRAGGGTAIGGLVDGQTYYAIVVGPHAIELADSACHADPGGSNCSGAVQTPITLNAATAGTDRAHSILKQGDQPPGDAASVSGQHVIVPNSAGGFHGVSVTANNSDDIGGFGVAAGFGTVGVSVSGSVNVITANTSAFIGRIAQVNVNNAGASSAQSVVVAAGNAFQLLIVAASVAAGAVGVGANAAVGIVTLNTDSVIGAGAVVNAARDVVVAANASDQITAVAAAAAGGAVGVAGVVAVIVLNTHTYADTGLGVAVTAGNNALFSAADATKITVVSGGAAVGAVGVGIGVAVTSLTKDTRAFIGAGSAVDALAQQPGVALAGIDDGTVSGSGFGTLGGIQRPRRAGPLERERVRHGGRGRRRIRRGRRRPERHAAPRDDARLHRQQRPEPHAHQPAGGRRLPAVGERRGRRQGDHLHHRRRARRRVRRRRRRHRHRHRRRHQPGVHRRLRHPARRQGCRLLRPRDQEHPDLRDQHRRRLRRGRRLRLGVECRNRPDRLVQRRLVRAGQGHLVVHRHLRTGRCRHRLRRQAVRRQGRQPHTRPGRRHGGHAMGGRDGCPQPVIGQTGCGGRGRRARQRLRNRRLHRNPRRHLEPAQRQRHHELAHAAHPRLGEHVGARVGAQLEHRQRRILQRVRTAGHRRHRRGGNGHRRRGLRQRRRRREPLGERPGRHGGGRRGRGRRIGAHPRHHQQRRGLHRRRRFGHRRRQRQREDGAHRERQRHRLRGGRRRRRRHRPGGRHHQPRDPERAHRQRCRHPDRRRQRRRRGRRNPHRRPAGHRRQHRPRRGGRLRCGCTGRREHDGDDRQRHDRLAVTGRRHRRGRPFDDRGSRPVLLGVRRCRRRHLRRCRGRGHLGYHDRHLQRARQPLRRRIHHRERHEHPEHVDPQRRDRRVRRGHQPRQGDDVTIRHRPVHQRREPLRRRSGRGRRDLAEPRERHDAERHAQPHRLQPPAADRDDLGRDRSAPRRRGLRIRFDRRDGARHRTRRQRTPSSSASHSSAEGRARAHSPRSPRARMCSPASARRQVSAASASCR